MNFSRFELPCLQKLGAMGFDQRARPVEQCERDKKKKDKTRQERERENERKKDRQDKRERERERKREKLGDVETQDPLLFCKYKLELVQKCSFRNNEVNKHCAIVRTV